MIDENSQEPEEGEESIINEQDLPTALKGKGIKGKVVKEKKRDEN